MSVDSIVLDASAILAFLQQEPGGAKVLALLEGANARVAISAVNFSEVMTKLVRDGGSSSDISVAMEPFRPLVIDFDLAHAERAAELYPATQPLGLSFGDRACFALAASRRARVWTADRAWKKLKVGVQVELVRG
jgi:ribonuclease VapC